ncbi:hypothetical protein IYX23_05605 [Methylocystis sp. L43]|uniref:hypothetical protein n=1 Tax=unclassified Methylocystis TaxID=2625913 RepID=UPI0018C21AAC|nr:MULTISPECIES: hypothetical protein [unclassified Methylocystis]MBG0797162.1 hypothetical protein [Methylocystis sp. L43]MBG0804967.1 hypothetical protein [Methylocystis sp. H15]
MRKRNSQQEWLPWYRARGFKGSVSEAEKRHLDAYRSQPKHPAATYADLPEEAQSYISGMIVELLDKKREALFGWSLFWTTLAGALLLADYHRCRAATIWEYMFLAGIIVMAWVRYWFEDRKIVEEFFPSGISAPTCADEALRREWELQYLVENRRHAEKQADEWDV